MSHMKRSRISGRLAAFTLVELLVVIGIISILIAMLLPALNRARESAKTLSCLSNVRQIMLGIQMYANDNRGSLPPAYFDVTGQTRSTKWDALLAMSQYGYVKNVDVFICPSRRTIGPMADLPSWLRRGQTDANQVGWGYVSYGVNSYGAMPSTDWAGYKLLKISAPRVNATSLAILVEGYQPSYAANGYWGGYQAIPRSTKFEPWVHGGSRVNVGFLDGHCSSLSAAEVGWDAKAQAWITPAAGVTDYKYGTPWYFGVYTNP